MSGTRFCAGTGERVRRVGRRDGPAQGIGGTIVGDATDGHLHPFVGCDDLSCSPQSLADDDGEDSSILELAPSSALLSPALAPVQAIAPGWLLGARRPQNGFPLTAWNSGEGTCRLDFKPGEFDQAELTACERNRMEDSEFRIPNPQVPLWHGLKPIRNSESEIRNPWFHNL
jgi:hypothetical protein